MTDTAKGEILPWQVDHWRHVLERRRAGKLPHALLLDGPSGMGKAYFADLLAQSVLCQRPLADGTACGACRGCHLYAAGTHPDALQVRPRAEGKPIVVDQVRALTSFMALTTRSLKVAIVVPAEAMNVHAANSLLKTLEEPPPDALMLLVSHAPNRLPLTVRSRCQRLRFQGAGQAGLDWLAGRLPTQEDVAALWVAAEGGPFGALAMAGQDVPANRLQLVKGLRDVVRGRRDPVAASDPWLLLGLPGALRLMLSWLCDVIRWKCTAQPRFVRNTDLSPELRDLAAALDVARLQGLQGALMRAWWLVWQGANVNPQLAVGDLLIAWAQAGRASNAEE